MHTTLSPDGRYQVEWGVTRSKTDLFDDDTYYEVCIVNLESGRKQESYAYSHLQSAAGRHEDDIGRLERLKMDSHPAVVAAMKEDPYYFNLHAARCRGEVYGDTSDKELTLEDFRTWIEG